MSQRTRNLAIVLSPLALAAAVLVSNVASVIADEDYPVTGDNVAIVPAAGDQGGEPLDAVAPAASDSVSIVPVDDAPVTSDELEPVPALDLEAIGEGAIPQTIFTTKVGRFVHYDRWELECNIGELQDCAGGLVVKIGSDTPNWEGWEELDGRWVRGFGELAFLPSECGPWLNVTDPDDNIRIIYDDPCEAVTPTPPSGGGGGGNVILECIGSSTSATYPIRSGNEDAEWSRQQGLKTTKTILPMGGNFGYDPIVGLRFRGVAIPRNAKILSSRVRFAPAASSGIDVHMDVFGANVGNAGPWGGGFTPGNAPRTPHFAEWQITTQWTGSQDCRYISTSSLSAPIQDVVLRGDWNAGNGLALLFEWDGPFAEASQRPTYSIEGGCAPQLSVTWCPARIVENPGGGGGNATSTPDPKNVNATRTPTSTSCDPKCQTATASVPTVTKTPPTRTPSATTDPGGTVPSATPTETAPSNVNTATPTETVEADTPTPTPTEDVPNSCGNPYDLNDDGVIDILDIDIVIAAFGSSPGSPNWNADADVNGDLVVDIVDYLIVRENFGPSCPPKGTF